MPIIPELRRPRPENYKFKASQCYIDSRRDWGADKEREERKGKINLLLYFIAIV